MSSPLLLATALLSTFGAVVLAGVAWARMSAERKRPARVLEAQVGKVSVNMRERDLEGSFVSRAVVPGFAGFLRLAKRVTSLDAKQRIERRLAVAGAPEDWDAMKVAAVKIMGGIAGLATSMMFLSGDNMQPLLKMAFGVGAPILGYMLPDVFLSRRGRLRQEEIQRTLPDTMDLLTLMAEAGLGFDAALTQVLKKVPGPLSEEFGRTLHEIRLGVNRSEAFRNLGKRTDVEDLDSFIMAMIQADVFGVSTTSVLRAQAKELRAKRRQRAERAAQQLPVKMVFPLIFCILPALFVVVLGPAVIGIIDTFFKT